jgi:hypothetical protein
MGIVMVLLFLVFFVVLLLCRGDGDLLRFFTKIEKIKIQMHKIKKFLVKLHAVCVFPHKILARGIPFNHLEVVALIVT